MILFSRTLSVNGLNCEHQCTGADTYNATLASNNLVATCIQSRSRNRNEHSSISIKPKVALDF